VAEPPAKIAEKGKASPYSLSVNPRKKQERFFIALNVETHNLGIKV
jgi:hypothetical protein